ncbi:MAG: hypothetical protein SFU27_11660 [Thermonemataceae bacterium]|nr:hypothetical protein [Thermonemataceae bacterium]
MKNSKIWLVIGFNLFFLFNTWHVESCGYFEIDWELYRFFSPEQANTQKFRPLYFSFNRFYDANSVEKNNVDENLQEWQSYFKNQASQKDLESFIYKSNQQDLDKVRSYVLLQKPLADAKLANNSAVQYLASKNKDAEAIEYIIFAKKCEKYAYRPDEWSEPAANAKEMLSAFSKEAEKRYGTAKEPFIKLRYAYQAIRLAHYSEDYKATIYLYDKLVEPLKTENVIKYWALGHKAGALRSLGQNAMSAYLFGIVFEKSTAKRVSAFLSCKVFSDADWDKALSYCKNNKEKANLFCIRGIQPQNMVLPEMMAIYNFDPKSDYLDMLLLREINKVEMTLMPLLSSHSGFEGYATSDQIALYKAYLPKLKTFILQYLKNAPAEKQALWVMALGYTDYLLGKPSEARKSFASIDKNKLSTEGSKQMTVFETMIELMEINVLEKDNEEVLYKKVSALNNSALKSLMVATFERHYLRQGEKAKAYLSFHILADIKVENKWIDELLDFSKKSDLTSYEKELLAKIDSKNAYQTLLEIKATLLFAEDNLDEAEKLFKEAGINTNLKGKPNSDEIIDCIECPRTGTYTKLGLIQEIKTLQKQATKGSADAYLKLGNIYYNTTFFGHCWEALDYYRSGSTWTSYGFEKNTTDRSITDCSKAQEYYQKAMELYEKNKNKEMAAKACFLAAKAEQNNLFASDDFRKDRQNTGMQAYFNPKYRTNFDVLKQKYRNSNFYSKAIKECFYISLYN